MSSPSSVGDTTGSRIRPMAAEPLAPTPPTGRSRSSLQATATPVDRRKRRPRVIPVTRSGTLRNRSWPASWCPANVSAATAVGSSGSAGDQTGLIRPSKPASRQSAAPRGRVPCRSAPQPGAFRGASTIEPAPSGRTRSHKSCTAAAGVRLQRLMPQGALEAGPLHLPCRSPDAQVGHRGGQAWLRTASTIHASAVLRVAGCQVMSQPPSGRGAARNW